MAMPGVASIADVWNQGVASPGATVHVEPHSETHCIALSAADCALCTFLTQCVPQSAAPRVTAHTRHVATCAPHAINGTARRIAIAAARPRAPPVG
jgi:hypothetical protein